jgi:hypothetical protein
MLAVRIVRPTQKELVDIISDSFAAHQMCSLREALLIIASSKRRRHQLNSFVVAQAHSYQS